MTRIESIGFSRVDGRNYTSQKFRNARAQSFRRNEQDQVRHSFPQQRDIQRHVTEAIIYHCSEWTPCLSNNTLRSCGIMLAVGGPHIYHSQPTIRVSHSELTQTSGAQFSTSNSDPAVPCILANRTFHLWIGLFRFPWAFRKVMA